MELKGKVIACLEPKTGTGAKGEWTAQDFVIEIPDGNYTKKMVFTVWGLDRIQKFNIAVGQEITVRFDIDAREYNGKWYNSVKAYDVVQGTSQTATEPQQQPAQETQAPTDPFASNANNGDLFGSPVSSDDLPW